MDPKPTGLHFLFWVLPPQRPESRFNLFVPAYDVFWESGAADVAQADYAAKNIPVHRIDMPVDGIYGINALVARGAFERFSSVSHEQKKLILQFIFLGVFAERMRRDWQERNPVVPLPQGEIVSGT